MSLIIEEDEEEGEGELPESLSLLMGEGGEEGERFSLK